MVKPSPVHVVQTPAILRTKVFISLYLYLLCGAAPSSLLSFDLGGGWERRCKCLASAAAEEGRVSLYLIKLEHCQFQELYVGDQLANLNLHYAKRHSSLNAPQATAFEVPPRPPCLYH